ncbi:hypothetical protein AO262_19835 [Pseudomonas fluorescens ABAC62]|nr:hypothetical protein AO262_19835 [Pseudomonas fluorescens ABAC62]
MLETAPKNRLKLPVLDQLREKGQQTDSHSVDPYHGKTDLQVVEAFHGAFKNLRDKSQGWGFASDHQYAQRDMIIEVSRDPDETDRRGNIVRDPANNGFAKKKYTENQVYICRNLVDRCLLDTLEGPQANGSRHPDRWFSSSHFERRLKDLEQEKGL